VKFIRKNTLSTEREGEEKEREAFPVPHAGNGSKDSSSLSQ
jgi:hypothetical protein